LQIAIDVVDPVFGFGPGVGDISIRFGCQSTQNGGPRSAATDPGSSEACPLLGQNTAKFLAPFVACDLLLPPDPLGFRGRLGSGGPIGSFGLLAALNEIRAH